MCFTKEESRYLYGFMSSFFMSCITSLTFPHIINILWNRFFHVPCCSLMLYLTTPLPHRTFLVVFIILLSLVSSCGEGNGTHSSTLAWKTPWTEEPGRLQSMGSLGVGHDWATSFSLFTFMHWRRTCHPTPVFLPGESQVRGSLVGCRLWVRTESDMTEAT